MATARHRIDPSDEPAGRSRRSRPTAAGVVVFAPRAASRCVVLSRVIEVLGSSVWRLVSCDDGVHADIGDVSLHDGEVPPRAGDLVLAVAADAHAAVAAIQAAARAGAPAVACKPPAADAEAVVAAADQAGVALLRVEPEVAWDQVHLLARAALACAHQPPDRPSHSVRLGDVFAVADALALRTGGTTTIEDPQGRVLAYSTGAECDVDEAGRETILRRAAPPALRRHLEDTGLTARVRASHDVVEMAAVRDAGLRRRLGVCVRAGSLLLGVIWVAEGTSPLARNAASVLAEAVSVVASHLLAQRARADVECEVRGRLLRRLLDGVDAEGALAERLGIPADAGCCVVAFRVTGCDGADAPAVRDRVAGLVALHAYALHWQAVSAWLDGTLYAVLPTRLPPARVLPFATAVVERIDDAIPQVSAVAGVGSTVARLGQAGTSRRDADHVVRAVQARGRSAATIDQVSADRVLLVLHDLYDEGHPELACDTARALAASDAAHGTVYVETLRAYFDAFGNVPVAADDLGIHPNTLRYRVRRAAEVAGLDLHDAHERLAIELGLRLLPVSRDAAARSR